MNIFEKIKKKKLERLLLNSKSDDDVINALKKTFPLKKVKPIDDAWNYLVKEGMIVFGDEDKKDYKGSQQEYK